MGSSMTSSSSRWDSTDRQSRSRIHGREEPHKRSRHNEMDDTDNNLRLYSSNCDKLYRWSMWRMYINEEMSRTISNNHGPDNDQSVPTSSVTSQYLEHPDCYKYGRLMRRMFGPKGDLDSEQRCLPDRHYLVYGIPRISLNKKVPSSVTELYDSCKTYEHNHIRLECPEIHVETYPTDDGDGSEEADQISELFRFVGSASNLSGDKHTTVLSERYNTERNTNTNSTQLIHGTTQRRESDTGNNYHKNLSQKSKNSREPARGKAQPSEYQQVIPPPPPQPPPPPEPHSALQRGTVRQVEAEHLVSKSRMFWEKLAVKKNEIIQMSKEQSQKQDTPNSHVLSSEILLKQHKLLKSRPQKRSSKDMWRSLADRRGEILALGDWTLTDNDNIHSNGGKHHESKTSQLWNFIFSRKRELIEMKKGKKQANGNVTGLNSERNEQQTRAPSLNFEDNFQSELAEKLRRRRHNIRPKSESEY